MAAASPTHASDQGPPHEHHDELKEPLNIDEFSVPENYTAPAQKSMKEIIEADHHDESLRKYKEKLLSGNTDEQILVEPNNPLNVLVRRLCVVVDGEIKHSANLHPHGEFTFVIKEGSIYKFQFEFHIQREIVTGLKYLHKVSRMGVGVHRETLMLGSFAPRNELYVFTSPPEEAPHGLLSRGKYKVRSLITDDDKHRWLEWHHSLMMTPPTPTTPEFQTPLQRDIRPNSKHTKFISKTIEAIATAQDEAVKPVGGEEQAATDTQRALEKLHQLARLAELSERYDDMKGYVKELVIGKQGDISTSERDLLSIAYKHVVASVRNAHRILQNVSAKRINDDEKAVVEEYRGEIQKRLLTVCSELQDLLSNYLIPKAKDVSSKVFYQKMMGDYTRYVAETKGQDDDFKEIVEKSRHAYQQAFDLATKNMPPTDPILLGLVLNFSVFYYEIANAAPEAAQLAKKAFDDAVANLEGLDENAYKDSTMIMELLRENLALWKLDGGTETSDEEQTAEAPALEERSNPDAINKEEEPIAAPDAMQVDTPKEAQPAGEQTKPDERGEPMDADEQGSAVIVAKVEESHNEPSDKQEGAKTEVNKDKPSTESS